MTQMESWEYAKMEEGVVFHPGTKTFRVKYLFTDNPRKLPDNRTTITCPSGTDLLLLCSTSASIGVSCS